MASLSAFLHPVKVENQEVFVSERFQENGKPVPFVIRPITQQENEALLKKHRSVDKKTGVEQFNRVNYNRELTAMAVVEPDLSSAELQKAYGVLGADKVLSAMLFVGEYGTLMEAVQELSGLDKDINDDIEEAKNGSGRATQS